jgi:hypothetical protein
VTQSKPVVVGEEVSLDKSAGDSPVARRAHVEVEASGLGLQQRVLAAEAVGRNCRRNESVFLAGRFEIVNEIGFNVAAEFPPEVGFRNLVRVREFRRLFVRRRRVITGRVGGMW